MKFNTLLWFVMLVLVGCLQGCDLLVTGTPPLEPADPEKNLNLSQPVLAERILDHPSIQFDLLKNSEGSLQGGVNCGMQDHSGFMWFGTNDGLFRYDGQMLTVFRHESGEFGTLSDNQVLSLLEDNSGTLWVGTEDGLNRFDPAKGLFTAFHHDNQTVESLSNDTINTIFQDKEGRFWVGTNNGLNLFDLTRKRFIPFFYDDADDPASRMIHVIVQDKDGLLWIGTDGGLQIFNPDNRTFYERYQELNPSYLRASLPIHSIQFTRNGEIWIGASNGIIRLGPTGRFLRNYQQSLGDLFNQADIKSYGQITAADNRKPLQDNGGLSSNQIKVIFEDSMGLLWIGTMDGLNLFDPLHERFFHYRNDSTRARSLSSDAVFSITQDRSGMLWFMTKSGVNIFDPSASLFANYHADATDGVNLMDNNVYSAAADRDGGLWVGTARGLNHFNVARDRVTNYIYKPYDPKSINNGAVISILQDRRGYVWVGTAGGGLNRYDPRSDSFVRFVHLPSNNNSPSNDLIGTIFEDKNDNLWIGCGGGYFDKIDATRQKYTHYYLETGNPETQRKSVIRSIVEDQQGLIWLGTPYGLYSFDPEENVMTRYRAGEGGLRSLSDDNITSLYADQEGILWIGTNGGGLNQLDTKRGAVRYYHTRDGLPSDVILGVLEDDQGQLWMSTNSGISVFKKTEGVFRNFDIQDGLQGNEFNDSVYYKSSRGEMFFGGPNGLTAFYPNEILDNPYLPPIAVTRIAAGDMATGSDFGFADDQTLTLNWPDDNFEFEFAVLNYRQPQKNQHSYRLEGLEQDWNPLENRRYGRYTNLPGGNYTLRLIGSNDDGVWNERGVSIPIKVVPPLWQRQWFRYCLVIFAAGLLFIGYRVRVTRVQTHNRILSQQVTERTQEVERRRKTAEVLRDVVILLNSDHSIEESLCFITRQAQRITGAEKACLFHAGNDEKIDLIASDSIAENKPGHKNGCETPEDYPDEALQWLAGQMGHPERQLISALEEIEPPPPPFFGNIHSLILVPIMTGDSSFGGLAVMFLDKKACNNEELELLSSLADQAALAIGNAQLRKTMEEMAVMSERSRLARDLHDAVTQTLFSACLIAEALPDAWANNRREGLRLLEDLRQLNRGALAEMRTLLMELRPAALVEAKFPDLLRQLAEAVSGRTGMDVVLNARDIINLPEEVHIGLYRIVQEALTNVTRHACAGRVEINLAQMPLEVKNGDQADKVRVILEINDNGCGFDPGHVSPERFGLTNMKERSQSIGAVLEISSQVGKGTCIRFTWDGKKVKDG